MATDRFLAFENGDPTELLPFLMGAASGLPVRIICEGEAWGPPTGDAIATARPGVNLRFISIRGTRLGDAGAQALVKGARLASLPTLAIERSGLTDAGVQALAASPNLARLRELYLCNRVGVESGTPNRLGDAAAVALAASPNLGHLERLDLWQTDVGDAGIEALVTSPLLPRLSSLTVWATQLTRAGFDRVQKLATDRWHAREATEKFPPLCWLHTDYDERHITYE